MLKLIALLLSCLPLEYARSRVILPDGSDVYALTVKQERTDTWNYWHWTEHFQRTESIERGDLVATWQHYQRPRNEIDNVLVSQSRLVLWYVDCQPFEENAFLAPTEWIITGQCERRARWSE